MTRKVKMAPRRNRRERTVAKKKTRKRAATKSGATPAPRRDPAVVAWLAREIAEQEKRYRRIVREMDALEKRRRRWVMEFYERIQTRGYSVHAGIRRKVAREEIPPLPKGRIRVVW